MESFSSGRASHASHCCDLKLKKYQFEKLECILSSKDLSVSKNKNFKKIQEILVDNFKNLQLAPHIVEELVQAHYKENK